MDGQIDKERASSWNSISGVRVYFSTSDIEYDYEEIKQVNITLIRK